MKLFGGKYAIFSLQGVRVFSSFQVCVCGIFFLNDLTPPSKGKVMPKSLKDK